MSRLIRPGEKGFDVAFHYPSAQSAKAQGYTFMVGYDSPNPLKNLSPVKAQEYLDADMGVWIVYEVNAGQTNLGYGAGLNDGRMSDIHLSTWYPSDIATLAANDTDTTAANIVKQTSYHTGFKDGIQKSKGLYGDIDIGKATSWDLGWLPNAWGWDHPNPKLKSIAIQQARELGYHMVQGRMSDDVSEPSYDTIDGIAVDINWCIKECYAWGNPRKDTDMNAITFEVTDLPGIYLWAPGMTNPIPFDNLVDLDLIGTAMGATRCTAPISQEMYNRLHVSTQGPQPGPGPAFPTGMSLNIPSVPGIATGVFTNA